MPAQHIAAAEVYSVPTVPSRSAALLGDGSFLDAVQVANAVPPTTIPISATAIDKEINKSEFNEVIHPYDEDESWNTEGWNAKEESNFFGEDGFDFGDLLDIINPLQHLPVISSIYRSLTGDEISPAARLAGGALFGGPIGFAGALISGVVEDVTDTTLGEVIVDAFTGDDETESGAQVASNSLQVTPEKVMTAGESPAMMPQSIAPIVSSGRTPVSAETRQPIQAREVMAALETPKPSPLTFARNIVESRQTGIAPHSARAISSVIAADEAMRVHPDMSDPVSAVLSARSQVPSKASISGLSSHRNSPVLNAGVETNRLEQSAISRTVSKRSSSENDASGRITHTYEPGKRGVPPPRSNFAALSRGRRRAAAAAAVPNTMVPKAMISALDKYESMLLNRNRANDKDLTM